MLAIEQVFPNRFPGWVVRRPFAVVFLVEGVRGGRPREVVDRLDLYFPGEISVGWMSRDAVTEMDWWSQHWVTERGPMVRQGEPPQGVYLFHLGTIVAHHAATSAAGTSETWVEVREYLLERIRLRREMARAGDATDWSAPPPRTAAPPPRQDPPPRHDAPPPPRRPVPAEGPYEVLELSPSATDVEAKKAYREAVRLNHPDKVAHLSRAIQRFAHERMLLINAAWETIQKERGIR